MDNLLDLSVSPLPYDRNDINVYLQLANKLINEGKLTDAILILLEGSRVGSLPDNVTHLMSTLFEHADVDRSTLLNYFEKIGQNPISTAKRNLKILVITNLLPPQEMGGFGRTVWEFIDHMLKRGHDVLALTSNMPQHQKEGFEKYQDVEKHIDRCLRLVGDWIDGRVVLEEKQEKIAEICTTNQITIMEAVHTFSPDVCMLGNLDLIGYNYLADIAGKKIPMLHRLGNSAPGFPASFKFDDSYYILAGCSEWLNDIIKKAGYNFSHYAVVYPGAPIEYYYKYLKPPFDILRICFASLLMPYKGAQTLIESLVLLKENNIPFTCEIAGDSTSNDFIAALKNHAKKFGFYEQVEFKGFLSKEEMSKMFGRCNTLVFPSVFDEPFGKTQIEAMAAGLCVVSSGTGGSKEIVQDGVNGLLFEKENAVDLANKLLTLYHNKEYWEALAIRGQSDAFKFTTHKSVEKIEKEFVELLDMSE